MTAVGVGDAVRRKVAERSTAVLLVQAVAFTSMVFPSDVVFKPVGGGGYVGALVAYLLFAAYLAVVLFGQHDPFEHRSPVRIALAGLWITSFISYALMNRTLLSSAQLSSSQRWFIQLAGISGIILVASEFLRSLEDIHKVLRGLTWGGAVCGFIAAAQYWLHRDYSIYLHRIPGFSLNAAAAGVIIGDRGGLNRVVGTATDPITLGVVAGMLFPIAIYLAMNDTQKNFVKRWVPVLLIGISIPFSLSRSAILSVAIGMCVLIVSMSSARRVTMFAMIPVGLAGVFVSAHRLLGTLGNYFSLGTSGNSVGHRLKNVPYALNLIRQAPWFGHGGGTYIATNIINLGAGHIMDDQYLDAAIELGVVGLIVLIFFFLWPALTSLVALKHTRDPQLRELAAALGGAGLSGVVCSATFDSLSFPMFVMVEALVIGLSGALWLLINSKGSISDGYLQGSREELGKDV